MSRRGRSGDGESWREESAGQARARLIVEIAADARETARWTGRPVFAPAVMAAIARVPRQDFAPFGDAGGDSRRAYVNAPFPIGHGQTISQPYIVALMTDLIDPEPDHVVLEIGTGSGYQAAVLAEIVARVHSIEVLPELAAEAAARLSRLGYDNVETRQGDGAPGWPERAPFDGIVVTAAAPAIPPALVEQLGRGGRMAIPVGRPWLGQTLVLIEKDDAGEVRKTDVLAVAFVPLVGEKG